MRPLFCDCSTQPGGRSVAGRLKLDLAQFRALAAFSKLASDLDKNTQQQLTRGEKITQVLVQPQYHPQSVEAQVGRLEQRTPVKIALAW